MLVYPILNFVLPLMLSSFVLVENLPHCSESQVKKENKIIENEKIDRIDTESSSIKSLDETISENHLEQDVRGKNSKINYPCEEKSSSKSIYKEH